MRTFLRPVLTEPRPPRPPVPAWRDRLLVGAVVVAVLLEGLLRPDLPARWFGVGLAVALAPALLWRRTRPLLMLAIAFAASSLVPLFAATDPALVTSAYLLLLPYALFRWGSGVEILAGTGIILAKMGLSLALQRLTLGDAVGSLVVTGAAFAVAAALRYRARLLTRELDQAKLLERERLARDLHDIVAHHVSAMAIRAQAGIAVAPARPEAAVEALHIIEAEAARALTELRTMVRALRGSAAADLAPSPGIPDIERLAADGPPSPVIDVQLLGDLDGIPPTVGTAIYRLAQESVTNARRHARHASRIQVRVAADAGSVRLRVSDDGAPGVGGSGGFGVAGMIERATLLGGTCQAGPDAAGGWTVTAALPRVAA